MSDSWPKPLADASGPMRTDKVDGALEGMGAWGDATRRLAAEGWLQPDLMTGLTLYILGHQPRNPEKQRAMPGAGGGVAGGVWVRERFTIHRPLERNEAFTVTGTALGRHVHKGRRYGTNSSETRNAAGQLAGTNLTTGLLAYKVQEGLADGVEGHDPDALPGPQPDWSVAGNNPCMPALRALTTGTRLGDDAVTVSLALMEARDTKKPDNPIHSDPELARKAGLSRPIAGGSHVLAFALEPIMAAAGPQALVHGASFDVRWKAPVYADLVIRPVAEVVEAADDRVSFALTATLEDGATAMTGMVTVPLA